MSYNTGEVYKLSSSTSAQSCHQFSIAEINSATNNFDDDLIIGDGGFGKVYKGSIRIKETSHVVAIKRLDSMSNQGAAEFKAEIEMLSKLRHCNLVSLIGYCHDNGEMVLVYLYMPHGTLYDHLHKATTPLSWVQRLKIAIGSARGLDYLHTGFGTQHGVIHRDVKSSNILLDENWAAMISDFGLSKIGPIDQTFNNVSVSVKGTFGYLDPEYFYTSKLTMKTDVYAFGVVLFELLSGMLAVDKHLQEEQGSLARWAQKCVKERKFDQMVDSNITGTVAPKCLRGFAEIANRCLIRDFEKRPSMTKVLAKLQDLLELQEKYDMSADSIGLTGFTWKIHKYLAFATKENSDQGSTSSPYSAENSNQYSLPNRGSGDHVQIRVWNREIVVPTDVKLFTYDELKSATMNFREIICHGLKGDGNIYEVSVDNPTYTPKGDGTIYKGWVDNTKYTPCKANTGIPLAVKRICYPFIAISGGPFEIFRHPNIVKLIGLCWEGNEYFLLYEFMDNGNFENLIHCGAIARLPLVKKVKIVVGIAKGIVFWNNTQHGIAKGSQIGTITDSQDVRRIILLDEDFKAKLSGYQLSKLIRDYHTDVYYEKLDGGSAFLCGERCLKSINFDAFAVVFAEVLTGTEISNKKDFKKIDSLLRQSGVNSLRSIAGFCFDKCNEVDIEANLLRILEKCEISNDWMGDS